MQASCPELRQPLLAITASVFSSELGSFAESLLTPLPYRLGVLGVVTVCIEPKAATETRVACELCFRRALDEVDETAVSVIQLPQHFGERKASLLLRRLGVEGVD